MDKPIFSITCATCQARLAVRSEAAVGAILECPKCHSMVQVTPPPGWTPAPPQPVAVASETPPTPAGPPPLDHVAAVTQGVDLEPAQASTALRAVLQKWMIWGGVPLVTLVAIISVLWALLAPPEPEPAATDAQQQEASPIPQSPDVKPVPPQKTAEKKAVKRPSATDAKKSTTKPTKKSTAKQPEVPKSPGVEQIELKKEAEQKEGKQPDAATAEDVKTQESKPPDTPCEATKVDPTEEEYPGEVKKTPPAAVDLAARCADPVAALELTDMPLLKAVDLLATMSTLPITIDADALEQLGVSLRDPISLQVSSTTIAKTLQALAAQKGLAFTAEGGQVFLGAPAKYRETLQKVRYTVADLTGDDKTATLELAAMIQNMVAPDSWQDGNGGSTLKAESGIIDVTQTGNVQYQVLVFLEKLRAARGKPLQTRDRPERFTLATRWDRARKMLEQRVTINYHEPTPLWKILAFLANAARCDILVDRAALAAVETSDRVETNITVSKQPLGKTLTALLQPLGLTYRAVGPRTIQVTTKEAAEERLELEFYPIGTLSVEKKNDAGQAVIEQLKKNAAALTWNTAGNLYFDPPSQCLIVLQPQAVQIAVERLLQKKEDERKQKEKGKKEQVEGQN